MNTRKLQCFLLFIMILCFCFIKMQLDTDNLRRIFMQWSSSRYRPRNATQTQSLVNVKNKNSRIAPEGLTLHKNLNNSNLKKSHKKNHQTSSCYMRCPSPRGRLGNQMFAFASTLGIAEALQCKFIIPRSRLVVKLFDIKSIYISDMIPTNMVTIKQEQLNKDPLKHLEKYKYHNMTTLGYLHSWKYFANILGLLRELFTIKSAYTEKAKLFLKENISGASSLIGIHVRRTDFISKQMLHTGKVVATKTYLTTAMELYRKRFKNSHFVVCSDDIRWCKKNIKGPNVTFSEFREAILDMAILSMCNHTIITVGTFGWWCGWLAGGIVVYLSDYPVPDSYLDKMQPKPIYYPPEWIGLSNKGHFAKVGKKSVRKPTWII